VERAQPGLEREELAERARPGLEREELAERARPGLERAQQGARVARPGLEPEELAERARDRRAKRPGPGREAALDSSRAQAVRHRALRARAGRHV
jgi:hypothetical protein